MKLSVLLIFNRVFYFAKREVVSNNISPINTTELLVKGSLCPEWVQELTNKTEVVVVKPKFTRKSINQSYCRITLSLHNNSDAPIVNGKIIIKATEDSVSFANTNVEEHSIAIALNTRVTQHIENGSVSESFSNPINPTAEEKLYDFFITANPEVKEFDLLWKLETLSRPYEGNLHITWNASFEDKYEEVKAGDSKVDTMEYTDYIIEE